MGFEIVAVEALPNDVLRVTARVPRDEGAVMVEVFGWVSATTNHYAESSYEDVDMNHDEDGEPIVERHRKQDARPRKMTAREVGAYARRLVLEQHPELAAKPVQFV